MSRFVLQSACRGRRPVGVGPRRLASRPDLVSRLLADRGAPRFLVAPDGYGKTSLACEYAEVVFGFRRVSWINGRSPCFLRDVDAGEVAPSLKGDGGGCDLVVFADVPLLDETRTEAFVQLLEDIAALGAETLVTTTPCRDSAAPLLPNRLVLDGYDLLVGDEEARRDGLVSTPDQCLPLSLSARIPCLRWSDEGVARLVEGCARAQLPADLRLALWLMMAAGSGTVEDVGALLGPARAREAWDFLAVRYPHVGIDVDEDAFEAVPVAMAALKEGYGAAVAELAAPAGMGRDELVAAVAERLIDAGRARRAAELMGCFAAKAALAAWLPRKGAALLWQDAGAEFCALFDRVARQRVEGRASVNAMMAWAHSQMEDRHGAAAFAKRALASPEKTPASELAAALAAHRCGTRPVQASMEKLLTPALAAWSAEAPSSSEERVLALLASVSVAEARRGDVLGCWAARASVPEPDAALRDPWPQAVLLAAAWVLDALAAEGAFEPNRPDAALMGRDDFGRLVAACAGKLDELAATGCLGYGGRRAAEALERVGEQCRNAGHDLPGPAVAEALERFRRESASRAPAASRASAPAASSLAPGDVGALGAALRQRTRPGAAAIAVRAPLLHVRLFGTMTVHIGDVEVSSKLLARKKARLLLALLVLHRGHELTRESLVSMLWPQTSARTGTKSFYRLWGELCQLLSVDGTCPYLLRDHRRCHVHPVLCTSDVMEFEELVRTLLFGLSGASTGWETVLWQVQESFSGELLPAEERCEEVAAFRRRYAAELVDGLVAASGRLRAAGEWQGALWFAREALRRDATREDVYAALMEAQMAVGQRGGALDTFFSCRSYLSDELGLDPSPQIMELYQVLIEGAPPLHGAKAAEGGLLQM